jgi:hypothetical protein
MQDSLSSSSLSFTNNSSANKVDSQPSSLYTIPEELQDSALFPDALSDPSVEDTGIAAATREMKSELNSEKKAVGELSLSNKGKTLPSTTQDSNSTNPSIEKEKNEGKLKRVKVVQFTKENMQQAAETWEHRVYGLPMRSEGELKKVKVIDFPAEGMEAAAEVLRGSY